MDLAIFEVEKVVLSGGKSEVHLTCADSGDENKDYWTGKEITVFVGGYAGVTNFLPGTQFVLSISAPGA